MTQEQQVEQPAEQPKEESKEQALGVGEKIEVRALQSRFKNGSSETVAQDEYKPLEFDPNSAYALVLTQKYDNHGRLEKTVLNVNSQHLLQMFRDVVKSHPTVPEGFEEPIEIDSPFSMLYHHWDDLHDHRKLLTEEVELSHMDLLLDFMRLEMSKRRTDISRAVQNGSIKFNDLWAIYSPDALLMKSERDSLCLLKLEKTLYENDRKCGWHFDIHCTRTINDGTGLHRRSEVISLYEERVFGGNTPSKITELPVFPFDLAADGDGDIKKQLIERGSRIEKLTGINTMRYSGVADYQKIPPRSWFDPRMEDYDTVWLGFTETGRVVIDPKTYLEDYPVEAKSLSRIWPDEYRVWAESTFGSFEAANRALCTPFIHGYSVKKKQWCKFYEDNLQPVKWDDAAIQSLVIPDTQKSVLEALVTSHQFSDNPREVQSQKGKGLVILLHGTPGSGKTLTAEVAAELSHSPLLPISLGELYEYEYFNEDVLRELLQYATIWKAVVLIDEADVFLEARQAGKDSSATRNALVASFLRALEYFSGIVFLTSNRVEDFDAAMKSRIHLAIQYSPPAVEVRKRIWSARLGAIPDEELDFSIDDALDTLVQDNMNGREISNTINTARTLARHQGKKLQLAHLSTVIEAWRTFNSSLKKLQSRPRRNSFGTLIRPEAAAAIDNEGFE